MAFDYPMETKGAADKIVLVIEKRSPRQTPLSRIKAGDTFLEFPSLRTDVNVPAEELCKSWAVAVVNAVIYTLESGYREWGIKSRPLSCAEEAVLPKSCGGAAVDTVFVEGVVIHGGQADPEGDIFDAEGVAYRQFLEEGYMTSRCTIPTRIADIVGKPKTIERRGDDLHLRAEVFKPEMVALFRAKVPMGFALAGKVIERRGEHEICRMEVDSVAIVPADKLSDPRCRCYLVEESD